MFCPNCGNQVEDGSRFCAFCGNRFGTPPFHPTQEPAAPHYTEAENNAFFVQAEQPPVPYAAPMPAVPGKIPGKRKLSNKTLMIGGVAVAALLLLVLAVVMVTLSASGSAPSYALYIKDGEIFYNGLSGKESAQVTEDLTDGEDVDNSDLYGSVGELEDAMYLTDDGKTLFYMDEISNDGTLYCRSVANFNKEPVKIASGVEKYAVCSGGKLLFYLKNGVLHQCKSPFGRDNDEKLERDVFDFGVTADGEYILIQNEDSVYYIIHKGEKEKVGSEIELEYIDDQGTVYYMDGDHLYAKPVGKDKQKLLSDVEGIFGFTGDGTFYFTRREDLTLADFFAPDDDYSSWMKNMEQEQVAPYFALYYYNGKEEVLLTEGCCKRISSYYDGEKLAVCYSSMDPAGLDKLHYKMLEKTSNSPDHYYSSLYDVAEMMIEERIAEDVVTCVAIDGTVSQVDVENVSKFACSPDCKRVYFMCDVDEEKERGTVYQASVSGKKVAEPEEFDDDVYSERGFYFVGGSDYFIYFKDVKDNEGEMFVNGKSVDDDVHLFRFLSYNAHRDELLYTVDFEGIDYDTYQMDGSRIGGTVKAYDGKKSKEIADDVYDCIIAPNGDVVLWYDYNTDRWEGSLAVYDGKFHEIAEDVRSYALTPSGDVLYLYDYNVNRRQGNLAAYVGGKVHELDEDVVAIIDITEGYYRYFDA